MFEILAETRGTVTEDEESYGGIRRSIIIARVGNISESELRSIVDEHYPAQHCQHEHDCCGRYYQSSTGDIERQGELAIITLTSYQNV